MCSAVRSSICDAAANGRIALRKECHGRHIRRGWDSSVYREPRVPEASACREESQFALSLPLLLYRPGNGHVDSGTDTEPNAVKNPAAAQCLHAGFESDILNRFPALSSEELDATRY